VKETEKFAEAWEKVRPASKEHPKRTESAMKMKSVSE